MVIVKKDLKFYFLYVLIAWNSIMPYLGRDGKGLGLLLLCLVCLCIFGKSFLALIKRNVAPVLYTIFAVYMSVNGILKDTPLTPFDLLRLFYPVVVMMLTTLCLIDRPKRFVTYLILLLLATIIISLIFEGESSVEEGRMGSVRNANDIGITCAIGLLLILFNLFFNWFNLTTAAILSVPFIIAILKTASRTSLGMVAFAAIGYVLLKTNFRNKKSILYLSVAIVLCAAALPVLKTTTMGHRVEMTTDQLDGSFQATGTIFDKLGDRGIPYIQSFPYFLENPITGIGIRNWIKYSPISLVFHSEYLTHYCENGIIGALFYITFIVLLVVPLVKRFRKYNKLGKKYIVFIFIMLGVILILNIVSWTFDRFDVFVIYGLIMYASVRKSPKKYLDANCTIESKKIASNNVK